MKREPASVFSEERRLILEGNSLLLLFYLKIHILSIGIWTHTCEPRTRVTN